MSGVCLGEKRDAPAEAEAEAAAALVAEDNSNSNKKMKLQIEVEVNDQKKEVAVEVQAAMEMEIDNDNDNDNEEFSEKNFLVWTNKAGEDAAKNLDKKKRYEPVKITTKNPMIEAALLEENVDKAQEIGKKFCDIFGPLRDSVVDKVMNFDQLVDALEKVEVVEVGNDFLLLVLGASREHAKSLGKVPPISGNVCVKIYFAAYMITLDQNKTFSEIGENEIEVIEWSKNVISSFYQFAYFIQDGNYWKKYDQLDDLFLSLRKFLYHFREWKRADQKKTIEKITNLIENKNQQIEMARQNNNDFDVWSLTQERNLFEAQLIALTLPPKPEAEKVFTQNPYSKDAGFTNQRTAHELLVDPEFNFTKEKKPSNEIVHINLNIMLDDISIEGILNGLNDKDYAPMLSALLLMRNSIVFLSKENKPQIVIDIEKIINCESFEYKASSILDFKAFCEKLNSVEEINFKDFFDGIVNVVSDVCDISSTNNDDYKQQMIRDWNECKIKINDNANYEGICEGIKIIVNCLRSVCIDTVNQKISKIAAVVSSHGVEYEKNVFEKCLKQGVFTMDYTKKWLGNTLKQIDVDSAITTTNKQIFIASFVDLIAEYPEYVDVFPETMIPDMLKLEGLYKCFHDNVTSKLIFNRVSKIVDDTTNVKAILMENPPKSEIGLTLYIDKVIDAVSSHITEEKDRADLKHLILEDINKKDSQVYQDVVNEFKQLCCDEITKRIDSDEEPRINHNNDDGEKFDFFSYISRLAFCNLKVHGDRYDEMIKSLS